MRKFTLFLALMFFIGMQVLQAQTRTITGTVTNADDGSTIPGVSVVVKGTTFGTTSDLKGNYTLNVPQDAQTLKFSFIGMNTVERNIGGINVLNVSMEPTATAIEGVVVTALGIPREKRTLGYSVQDVKGDELNQTDQINFVNALSGRVAGIQVSNSSGTMGGSSRVLIRGANSITGNNSPLYVVDGVIIDNSDFNTTNTARGGGGYDYGNMAQDINPDDIESVSVLKGPSASALYGSRAANGVILITTKKGTPSLKKGIGVTFSTGITFDKVSYLPKYQKLYGGGLSYDGEGTYNGFNIANIEGQDYLVVDYATDESWGPAYSTDLGSYGGVLAYNAFDKWDTDHYLKPKPWQTPAHDVEDFFETGILFTNNIALTGGSDKSTFRLSYTNQTGNGYLPNSNMDRHTVSLNADANLTSKLRAFTGINFIRTNFTGRPETGYGDNNIMVRFNQWGQRQLDMEDQKSYINPDGTQRTWNRGSWDDPKPVYSNNPNWSRYKDYQNDMRNHYFGNIGISYQVNDWISVQGKFNLDQYDFRVYERIAINSAYLSSYNETFRMNGEMNLEGMLLINKELNDKFIISGNLGVNQMKRNYENIFGTTNGGLVVTDLYNLSNSTDPATVTNRQEEKKINSAFGSVTLDYSRMLTLIITGRNDWSSTLPDGNNSYFYPSASLSWVFTELPALQDNNVLPFGKVRFSWAQVGNDTDPYKLAYNYIAEDNFGGNPNYRLSRELNNPDLLPEETSSWEIGFDLRWLQNRIGLDFTYYDMQTINQIIPVATSASTGYTTQIINAGKMTNKGIEIQLLGTPIKAKSPGEFNWNVTINYASNNNEVVELADGVTSYRLGSIFGAEVHAEVGKPFGSIRANNFAFDSKGNKVVGTNGRYLNGPIESIGSVLPDFNMGFLNEFRYKNFDLSFLIDWQKGGSLFSLTNMWGIYSGILEESATTNANGNNIRDDVDDGGGVLIEGVYGKTSLDDDGNLVVTWTDADGNPSDVPVTNEKYISGVQWAADHYSRARGGQNTFDADYIKLREVKIGYTFKMNSASPISGLNVALYGRNLAIWGRDIEHIDPEFATSSGNIQGIEGGQLPGLRSYGVNLTFNF
jgi:TonB-linked SusC/RagA family outer membrane protein